MIATPSRRGLWISRELTRHRRHDLRAFEQKPRAASAPAAAHLKKKAPPGFPRVSACPAFEPWCIRISQSREFQCSAASEDLSEPRLAVMNRRRCRRNYRQARHAQHAVPCATDPRPSYQSHSSVSRRRCYPQHQIPGPAKQSGPPFRWLKEARTLTQRKAKAPCTEAAFPEEIGGVRAVLAHPQTNTHSKQSGASCRFHRFEPRRKRASRLGAWSKQFRFRPARCDGPEFLSGYRFDQETLHCRLRSNERDLPCDTSFRRNSLRKDRAGIFLPSHSRHSDSPAPHHHRPCRFLPIPLPAQYATIRREYRHASLRLDDQLELKRMTHDP